MNNTKNITLMVVRPNESPETRTIESTLENMQEIVGGNIEVVRLEQGVVLVRNEEGKRMGLEPNRYVGDVQIVGTFIICSTDDEGEFASLNDDEFEYIWSIMVA